MPAWANTLVIALLALLVVAPLVLKFLIGPRFIGNTEVGIVEKTWGGGHLTGHIIALNNEAGFQPEVLRGGRRARRARQEAEAIELLVGSPVFKTERHLRAGAGGSIPLRFRHPGAHHDR